jgi:hypothetical protein
MVNAKRASVPGTVLVTVEGKLRGSKARQFGEILDEIADRRGDESVSRAVLDLRGVTSVDSLGTAAFESALERGLKLDIVFRRGFELDDGRLATALVRRGLRVYTSLETALGTRRSARIMAAARAASEPELDAFEI